MRRRILVVAAVAVVVLGTALIVRARRDDTPPWQTCEGDFVADVDIRIERGSEGQVRLSPVGEVGQPTAFSVRPRSDLLYVTERPGRVVSVDPASGATETVVDISPRVATDAEQGLLGLAFSEDGRHLWLSFTDVDGDHRIVELTMRGATADASSMRDLLRIPWTTDEHNAGQLTLGPDGMLWATIGDGGQQAPADAGDDVSQSLSSLRGKLLRLDPRPGQDPPYRVPVDNPFVGVDGARAEIWAYGLRNPWRFSFDRRTDDLWLSDVGFGCFEEVNLVSAGSEGGENFGWSGVEGPLRIQDDVPDEQVPPSFWYGREHGGVITGGYVYRGRRLPWLVGRYVYADFPTGELRALSLEGRAATVRSLQVNAGQPVSFGETADGELYVLALGDGLLRLDPA